MIKAVFIDVDDTLVVNQVLYDRSEAMLAGYLGHYGVTPAEVDAVFKKIDRDLFPAYGYSRERQPAGFEKTLLHFIPEAEPDMIKTVRGFAEAIFTTVARPKPDVAEALEILNGVAPIYIVTGGDPGVQKFRVDSLPFGDIFSGVHIVPKKDKDVFVKLAQQYGLKPEECVMIGDSLKSDVLSSTAAGMKAVWIEAHNSQHEIVKESVPANARKFSSLLEAARHIAKHGDLLPPKFQTGAFKPKNI